MIPHIKKIPLTNPIESIPPINESNGINTINGVDLINTIHTFYIFRTQYAAEISRERGEVSRSTRFTAAVAHADVLGAEDVLWYGSRGSECEQLEGAEDEEDGSELHGEFFSVCVSGDMVVMGVFEGKGGEKGPFMLFDCVIMLIYSDVARVFFDGPVGYLFLEWGKMKRS
jgi:hypothetical protein